MPEENYNGQYKLSIEQRITRVETQLNEIRLNHLPHLESKMDKMIWLIVTTLVGVVVSILLRLASSV